MQKLMNKKNKRYWGRRAPFYLIKDLNCALATQEVLQDMIGIRKDNLLRACTGLEGGVVASGSTCGVVTGGALGLALMYDELLTQHSTLAEVEVLYLVGEYVRWFENCFGSSLCRKRSGVNFYSLLGQLHYFFPGKSLAKCLWHIKDAIGYLQTQQEKKLPKISLNQKESLNQPIHCAQVVLKGIKDRTGISDPLLERLCFVFDGGVGLQGGICGALAGAILGINLVIGLNIREISYLHTIKAFIVGHINILRDKPLGSPETFSVGKNVVQRFREKAGSLECREITKKTFSDWNDFQLHISSSEECKKIIEFAINEGASAIKKLI